MAVVEFFKTLSEAKWWASYDMSRFATDVYGLDKPGTVREFREWRDDAVACERYAEAENARAVVVVYR